MNISSPFIERPIATSLLMIAIFLAGIFGYSMLPISSLPEIDYPTIQVITFYPGASPEVMTTFVTAPLERQFGQMPGLNQMTSNSSSGSSVIILQFDLHTTLDIAEQQVQASINNATSFLPKDLPVPPVYNKVNPADIPIITLALTSKKHTLPQIEDYADTRLTPKIAEVSGVGLVTIGGGQRPAVRIQANPAALSAYGLTLENVRSVIVDANVNSPKGLFDGPRLAYQINNNDQLLTSHDYKPLIVAYNNGSPVRLSDVAEVIDGAENVRQAAWKDNEAAILINIQRQPGANVIDVANRITELLPLLQNSIPADIAISVLTDRTIPVRASLHDVKIELVVSVILVVTVIFIFLGNIPATIIPSIVVPLSLIGTFAVMYFMGYSLNNLTLMALTVAAGFVVDDAIVMIENISRYIEQGDDPLPASHKGAQQIGFTIITLSISLIAVLIPLLFMQGLIGRLFREFAMTLSIAIAISAFISLTLTPMMCSRILLRNRSTKIKIIEKFYLSFMQPLVERYEQSLNRVLDNQKMMLIIAVGILFLTALLLFSIPKGFFPIQDTGVIQGITEASPSISFDAMAEKQQAVVKAILSDPAVENVSSYVGIDGVNTALNTGRIIINLKPLSQRSETASDIIRRLHHKVSEIPGVALYMQPAQSITIDNKVSRTQYQYSLSSPNGEEVALWTEKLINKLQQSTHLQDVTSDLQKNGLRTFINIDRDTASRLGITMQMIDNTLYDAFGQRQISTMYTQRNQYRVVLEASPELQRTPDMLENIYFTTSASSDPIPLKVFSTISQMTGPLVISRLDQFPVATVSFNLARNAALGDAINDIHQAEKALNLPPSLVGNFEGAARVFEESSDNEGWLFAAAIIVVYIALGILYESYIHPITILSTLPSAAIGALLALIITNNALTVIALIGIILLIGIVMKNAIMMIDFALEQERIYHKSSRDAIFEAAMLRFRPILMTTLASFFGAVPIAVGMGMGAELRQPLGIAIMGGLAFSQLLTLYTTPVIYIAFDKMSQRLTDWDLYGANPPISPKI